MGQLGLPASLGSRRWDEGRGRLGKPRAHPNPFPSGLSWNPWRRSLCSCCLLVALNWESPPLPVKWCGLLIILARGHSAFLGLDPLTWQVGNRVLSSFYFPVKSDLNSPGHCANLFLRSPEYPLSPSCIFTYTHTYQICVICIYKCGNFAFQSQIGQRGSVNRPFFAFQIHLRSPHGACHTTGTQ